MIKAIAISNLKGTVQARIELPRVAVLVGENGTGKTTVIQAGKLSITGAVPEANVSGTSDVFTLARSGEGINSLSVGLELDGPAGPFQFARNYSRAVTRDPGTGKTGEKVSQDITLFPANGETKLADKEAKIRLVCGLDPVSVDVRSFLDMSDAKRRDFFYGLGGAGKVDIERVRTALAVGRKGIGEAALEKYDELARGIEREWSGNLDQMLDIIAVGLKEANRVAKEAKAAANHMIEVKARQQTVAGELSNYRADLERAQSRKEEVSTELAKQGALVTAIQERERTLEYLAERIATLEKAEITAETIKKLEQAKNDLRSAVDKAKEEQAEKLRQLGMDCTVAEAEYEKAHEAWQSAGILVAELKSKAAAFEQLSDMADGFCDTCRAAFRKRMRALKETGIGEAEQVKADAVERVEQTKKAMQDARDAKYHYERDKQMEISRLERDAQDASRAFVQAGKDEENRLRDLEKTKKELDEARSRHIEEPLPVDHLKAELDGLTARIATLKDQVNEKAREENNLQVQLDSLSDAEQAETRAYCYKELVKILGPSGLKGQLVKETLDPIRADVQECLEIFGYYGCQFSFRMVDGRGNEIFDFGWINPGGEYVPFDGLSTGQQTILLISLVSVIVKRSSSPLKAAFFDNLEVVSASHEESLFGGLPRLAEYCGLDNLIAATSKQLPATLPAGLRVIRFPLNGGSGK